MSVLLAGSTGAVDRRHDSTARRRPDSAGPSTVTVPVTGSSVGDRAWRQAAGSQGRRRCSVAGRDRRAAVDHSSSSRIGPSARPCTGWWSSVGRLAPQLCGAPSGGRRLGVAGGRSGRSGSRILQEGGMVVAGRTSSGLSGRRYAWARRIEHAGHPANSHLGGRTPVSGHRPGSLHRRRRPPPRLGGGRSTVIGTVTAEALGCN